MKRSRMALGQDIAQDAVKGRQPGTGPDQQQRLLGVARDVEAVARRTEKLHGLTDLERIQQPVAHLAVRHALDLQLQIAVLWHAGK